MHELIANLHIHSQYSDGSGSYAEICRAALSAGLDVIILTDHNVLTKDYQGYFEEKGKRVLVLVGQEIHDASRNPQRDHLLVFGVTQDLTRFANHTQTLIDQVNACNGLSFIAHPYDPPLPLVDEEDILWENWAVGNYSGLEIWNSMSEFKEHVHSLAHGLFYSFFPHLIARGANPRAVAQWDELLKTGKRLVALGGSDAHALIIQKGLFKRIIFPYDFHFRAINTHIFTSTPLTGETTSDSQMVLDALKQGHAFIGYDLPVSTIGFRFTASGWGTNVMMGDTIPLTGGVTFQIRLPADADCILLKDGIPLKSWHHQEFCTFITNQPGIYRVECYIRYLFTRRGWIYTNPIYVIPSS